MKTSSDPNTFDESFLREIRAGLAVVTVLLGVFGWVAWLKYSGGLNARPDPMARAAKPATQPAPLLPFSSVEANRNLAEKPGAEPASPEPNSTEPEAEPAPPSAPFQSTGTFRPDLPSPPRREELTTEHGAVPFDPGSSAFRPQPPAEVLHDRSVLPAGFASQLGEDEPPSGSALNAPTDPGSLEKPPANTDERAAPMDAPNLPESGVKPWTAPSRENDLRADPPRNEVSGTPPESDPVLSEPPVTEVDPDAYIASTVHPRSLPPDSRLEDYQVVPPGPMRGRHPSSILARRGDSFWQIAQRVYGDGHYYLALFEVNKGSLLSIDAVPEGSRVSTPPREELQARFPELCVPSALQGQSDVLPGSVYTTVAGDTLFSIARDQLGQASRYLEIRELNRDRLPAEILHDAELAEGLDLRLPEKRPGQR